MATWNPTFEAAPADGDAPSGGAGKIRETRIEARTRLEKEHTWGGTSTADGPHKQGSAKVWVLTSAPTLRPDGATSLTADDAGRLWYRKSTGGGLFMRTSAGGFTSTGVTLSTAQTINGAKTFNGTLTVGSAITVSGAIRRGTSAQGYTPRFIKRITPNSFILQLGIHQDFSSLIVPGTSIAVIGTFLKGGVSYDLWGVKSAATVNQIRLIVSKGATSTGFLDVSNGAAAVFGSGPGFFLAL